jgi:hypothetical protein
MFNVEEFEEALEEGMGAMAFMDADALEAATSSSGVTEVAGTYAEFKQLSDGLDESKKDELAMSLALSQFMTYNQKSKSLVTDLAIQVLMIAAARGMKEFLKIKASDYSKSYQNKLTEHLPNVYAMVTIHSEARRRLNLQAKQTWSDAETILHQQEVEKIVSEYSVVCQNCAGVPYVDRVPDEFKAYLKREHQRALDRSRTFMSVIQAVQTTAIAKKFGELMSAADVPTESPIKKIVNAAAGANVTPTARGVVIDLSDVTKVKSFADEVVARVAAKKAADLKEKADLADAMLSATGGVSENCVDLSFLIEHLCTEGAWR